MTADSDGQEMPRRRICMVCLSNGEIWSPQLRLTRDGEHGYSAPSPRDCGTCDGHGWLSGLVPPV